MINTTLKDSLVPTAKKCVLKKVAGGIAGALAVSVVSGLGRPGVEGYGFVRDIYDVNVDHKDEPLWKTIPANLMFGMLWIALSPPLMAFGVAVSVEKGLFNGAKDGYREGVKKAIDKECLYLKKRREEIDFESRTRNLYPWPLFPPRR